MWRGPDGNPVRVPEPPAEFYAPIGDWQGPTYERNAFTKGTRAEINFLIDALPLGPEQTLLDVGCGSGRHGRALAHRGFANIIGVDISLGLLRAAARSEPLRLIQADARHLPLAAESVEVVLSLCQGGFGLTPSADAAAVQEMARVLRTGGSVALTAFSLDFASRWQTEGESLDVERGLHHHRAEVRGPDGAVKMFDLWTRCYTPASLTELLAAAGLSPRSISSVEPGRYQAEPAWADLPEMLCIATKV